MPNIDHLIICAPNLSEGIAYIQSIVGTAPVFTGQHPQWGTHNALLALGSRCFLEVIAPDPNLPIPETGLLFQPYFNQAPHLRSWVVQCQPIEIFLQAFSKQGIEMGTIQKGGRKRPDGSFLQWELSDPYANRLHGLVPFLIDWHNSRHPSFDLPDIGILDKLIICGEINPLANIPWMTDMPIELTNKEEFQMIARIKLTGGSVIEIK